jgi:PKD repeat protein
MATQLRTLFLAACTIAALHTSSWAAELSVDTYTLVSTKRLSVTEFEYVYKAKVSNTGPALRSVVGTVVSTNPATTIVEGALSFGDVASNASSTSIDTFTFRQNRSQPFDVAKLVWTVTGTPAAPIASDFTASPPSGNAPLSVTFTPTPTTNAAINRFEWDLDGDAKIDISDTVGRNQTRLYNIPGTYAVSLKITDSQNRTDTRIKNIIVGNAAPLATAQASPSNGQVPLSVNFTVTATDSDGIQTVEWDFDGDGTFERSLTSAGTTNYTYTQVGTFNPKVRVTDRLGAATLVSVPSMQVRAAPIGSPQATLSVSPASGAAPLNASLSATFSDPQRRAAKSFEWDFDGDGTFDANTTLTPNATHSYPSAGTFYPKVRITLTDGTQTQDVKPLTVTSTVKLSLTGDTLDPLANQTIGIKTELSATTRASLRIETAVGTLVRTLLSPTDRPAGTYTDLWDGKNSAGQTVPPGIYKAILVYSKDGAEQRLDLTTTTGGKEYNPPRTPIPNTFEPYNYKPLAIDFTLDKASEVTAFIGSFNVDTRYVTFYTRQVFGKGTQRITWNGENSLGQLISPAAGDSFLFGIFAYTLPDNAIYVRGGVQLDALRPSPPIFNPTALSTGSPPCTLQFNVNLDATAELVIQNTETGAVTQRLQYPNLRAGTNTITWDGKASDGNYAAPGTYRLGLTAIQPSGLRSLTHYVLQRVYY